jgi:hypothetical protein
MIKRIFLPVVLLLGLAACTPAQVVQFGNDNGRHLDIAADGGVCDRDVIVWFWAAGWPASATECDAINNNINRNDLMNFNPAHMEDFVQVGDAVIDTTP